MKYLGPQAKASVKKAFGFSTEGVPHSNPPVVRPTNLPNPAFRSPKGHRIQCVEIPAQAHLLPVTDYIRNRWSDDLIKKMDRYGVVVIFGTSSEVASYMTKRGKVLCQKFGTRSTASFSLYHTKGNRNQAKVVAYGIPSNAKFVDLCLRMACSGIDITKKLVAVGHPESLIEKSAELLGSFLKGLDTDKTTCFIGSPFRVIRDDLAKKVRCGVFNGLYNETLIALWIVNGDATYHMVDTLIKAGITRIVWAGAGCSLKPNSRIGDYHIVRGAGEYQYGKPLEEVPYYRPPTKQLSIPQRPWIDADRGNDHLSVDSPLQETNEMVNKAIDDDWTSFDVELVHLMKAVRQHPNAPLQITPGFFVSDTPNVPLKDKIGDALRRTPQLVRAITSQNGRGGGGHPPRGRGAPRGPSFSPGSAKT